MRVAGIVVGAACRAWADAPVANVRMLMTIATLHPDLDSLRMASAYCLAARGTSVGAPVPPRALVHYAPSVARFPHFDLRAFTQLSDVDLDDALVGLREIYDDIDSRNASNTANLDLPCGKGCSDCCHESVFLTPLEFFGVWDWAQQHIDDERRDAIIDDGLSLYAEHQAVIDALSGPRPAGERDHLSIAKDLRFRCPFLDGEGGCGVYPMREVLGRLFGCSFNDEGGVYGCHLVGAHLGGQTVTLLGARAQARRLHSLPLTQMRQVHPWYLNLMYGTRDG